MKQFTPFFVTFLNLLIHKQNIVINIIVIIVRIIVRIYSTTYL